MKQKNILIVDDEQVILDAVTRLCNFEGWQTGEALNVNRALSLINSNQYDLILSDIMLPDRDGFELLKEVQNHYAAIPVIITSGYSTVGNAMKALSMGAVDFIAKPFTMDEIISALKRGLRYNDVVSKLEAKERKSLTPQQGAYRLGANTWLTKEEDGTVKIGICQILSKIVGEINHIEFSESGEEILQGNSCIKLKSTDGLIHTIPAPISGRILERNEVLKENTFLLDEDPYHRGWFYRILPSELNEDLKRLTPC
jgi:DNA-binding response OmpR family regulator